VLTRPTRHPLPCVPAGINADYTVVVESKLPEEEGGGVQTEEIKVHRFMLEARSPFFRGMLESNMAEALQGRFVVREVLPPVAKAVLHFIYTGARAAQHTCVSAWSARLLPVCVAPPAVCHWHGSSMS
jgi:hypothetical protein